MISTKLLSTKSDHSFSICHRAKSIRIRPFLCLLILLSWISQAAAQSNRSEYTHWYKGNLHTHSLWSDGNDFPEMIAKWYKDHGYHFLGLSDHNILSQGKKWMPQTAIEKRGGKEGPNRYEKVFGNEWVEKRSTEKNGVEYRLKTLNEFAPLFNEAGSFLMIQSEEITDHFGRLPIHINASNLRDLIKPQGGKSVRETMSNNLQAIQRQSERVGRPIFAHVNHPNFGWGITAEDLAEVKEEKFFEVYNGHPGVRQLGDDTHPSMEKMWDIANTIRIQKLDANPLYGIATDDSHNYFGTTGSSPGRGWVMVSATHLSPSQLVNSLEQGNFYASSGVEIESFGFDKASKKYWLKIKPKQNVTFTTEFIGTKKNTPLDQLDKIGKTLSESNELEPVYQLAQDDLYVRVRITSSESHPNPSIKGQKQQAWLQPVWIKE